MYRITIRTEENPGLSFGNNKLILFHVTVKKLKMNATGFSQPHHWFPAYNIKS
jgi:hypothetical protein